MIYESKNTVEIRKRNGKFEIWQRTKVFDEKDADWIFCNCGKSYIIPKNFGWFRCLCGRETRMLSNGQTDVRLWDMIDDVREINYDE